MNDKEFLNFKKQVLKGKDFSKKGQIDSAIVDLVELINCQKSYVTLSSCSGRTIVVSQSELKKGCRWIYTTHGEVDDDEFLNKCSENLINDLVVKFEPFILHVGCQSLENAKSLLSCALNCGYRNSGIVLGANGKITLGVRSTLNVEVPISNSGGLLVSLEYLKFLGSECNKKMDKNLKQFKNFEAALIEFFNT